METQSLIIIAIVVAVVVIAGFFIFRIFIGGQKAADNEVGRHQQDIDDQQQVNRIKKEERERDERADAADPRTTPGVADPRDGQGDPNSPVRDEDRDNRHNSPMRDNVLSTDRDVLRDQPEEVVRDNRTDPATGHPIDGNPDLPNEGGPDRRV